MINSTDSIRNQLKIITDILDIADQQSASENNDKTVSDVPKPEITQKKLGEIKFETQIENLKTQIEIVQARVSALKDEEVQIESRNAGLRSEEESTKSNISSLKLEEEKTQERISDLKLEKELVKSEFEKCKENRLELENNLSNLKNDIDSTQEEIGSLRSEMTEKKNEIGKIEIELRTAKALNSVSEKEAPSQVIDAASEIVSQMNSKCQNLENELKMTKNILEKQKTDHENIFSEQGKLTTEFDSLESEKIEVMKSNRILQ